MTAVTRGRVGSFFPLPAELCPSVCAPFSLVDLAAVAAASRSGCVIVECLPAESWQLFLRRNLGFGLMHDLDPSEQWRHAYTLRDELRFWVKMCRRLGLSLFSGVTWIFRDVDSLKASRGMAEDALALLRKLDKDDVFGPWTRLPSMLQCCVQRLTFSFSDCLNRMYDIFHGSGRETFDLTFESTPAEVRACGVPVPCVLLLRCRADGVRVHILLSLQVAMERSDFPTSLGVSAQKALVVHIFISSSGLRLQGPRCVSYAGHDGLVTLLSESKKINMRHGSDLASSFGCRWVNELLVDGEMQALAVVDCFTYFT